MKKIALVLIVAFGAIQCKKTETVETDKVETSAIETEKTPTSILNNDCYIYDANGSKVELQITNSDNEISGNLNYQLKEKDSNKGTFKGVVQDSILIATYTFQSEGMESSREIVFKIQDNQLIEGYGEQVVEGSNAKFKDVKSIAFSSSMPLSKTDCSK